MRGHPRFTESAQHTPPDGNCELFYIFRHSKILFLSIVSAYMHSELDIITMPS